MDETNDQLGWLIRDTSNRIRGPFKQSEIVQLIKKGQLKSKTEIARANSYWFAIEEKTELARFLPEFNGGRPPPEQPTQMTATLTEADIQDRGVEITQFVSVPPKKEAPEEAGKKGGITAEGISSGTQQIEWLNDEMAQEFGDDFGVTISVQTDASGLKPMPASTPGAPTPQATEAPSQGVRDEENQPTPIDTRSEKARQEMLKRATVKADTLPSEHKSFQGDRPKPIDTLLKARSPGASASAPHQSNMVNVPVDPDPAPKMFMEEPESKAAERRGRQHFFLVLGGGLLLAAGLASYLFLSRGSTEPAAREASRAQRKSGDAGTVLRQSILFFDLEGAKSALSDLEQEPAAKSEAGLFLAQAIVKKEFLFDVEGAILALQMAKGLAKNKRVEAEVDNLLAIYSFDRDKNAAANMLRKNLENNREEPVFRYNLALGLIRASRPQEAIPILDGLLAGLNDNALLEDTALALGWALEAYCGRGARDPLCRRPADADEAFQRALQANPNSAKARLGLALFRLRRTGIRSSEGDFRTFLDSAADLDPPTRISNFRKLSDSEFYDFAHAQIVDLNTPGQNVSKPSPMIMASDALIASMQLKTSEAGKILDGALSAAPGEPHVLKAMGYLRWKDGRVNDVVDGLKDLKDRNSFALNLMLGKAYFKLRKREQAEKHYRALVENYPNRSEGHALLGELLLELDGNEEEAKAEFQQALKRDQLDLTAWRGLQKIGAQIVLSPEIQKNLPF
jgi:tetratricopeptide (TPR) repeat protein